MTPDSNPIDPPIPVPDVPGARGADVPAGADGLPRRSSLSLAQRVVIDSSAIGDLALRTAAASLLSNTVAPPVVAYAMCHPGRERRNLGFYAELAGEQDTGEVVSGTHRNAPGLVAASQRDRGDARAAARSTTSHSPAASERSTPRCAGSGADFRPTTSCMRSTGGTTTDHVRRCASSTASWVRRIC